MAEQMSKYERVEADCVELKLQLDEAKLSLVDFKDKLKTVRAQLTSCHHKDKSCSGADCNAQAETARLEATKSKEAAQSELDDLLMVFGDLEEKAAKYKVSDLGRGLGSARWHNAMVRC